VGRDTQTFVRTVKGSLRITVESIESRDAWWVRLHTLSPSIVRPSHQASFTIRSITVRRTPTNAGTEPVLGLVRHGTMASPRFSRHLRRQTKRKVAFVQRRTARRLAGWSSSLFRRKSPIIPWVSPHFSPLNHQTKREICDGLQPRLAMGCYLRHSLSLTEHWLYLD
jgi:hypothetical protein